MANIPEKARVTNQGSILKLACLAFFFFHSSISQVQPVSCPMLLSPYHSIFLTE